VVDDPKSQVKGFWNEAACGEAAFLQGLSAADFAAQARARYEAEPAILRFADFESWRGRRVLEVGVGLGADHQRFAEAGAIVVGVDLTERAVFLTQRRLRLLGLTPRLAVADAECLPFRDGAFAGVFSWGVIHHSPRTAVAAREIGRVLEPGGGLRVMIYNRFSLVGLMLWARYALLRLRPWRGLREIFAKHMESPGTQAFTRSEARTIFDSLGQVELETVLSPGDLLAAHTGQRHQGRLLAVAKRLWPRWFVRATMQRLGLFLLVRVTKA
jgi:SAM-dependent methyltransferase